LLRRGRARQTQYTTRAAAAVHSSPAGRVTRERDGRQSTHTGAPLSQSFFCFFLLNKKINLTNF
jgi:hypothetical protein